MCENRKAPTLCAINPPCRGVWLEKKYIESDPGLAAAGAAQYLVAWTVAPAHNVGNGAKGARRAAREGQRRELPAGRTLNSTAGPAPPGQSQAGREGARPSQRAGWLIPKPICAAGRERGIFLDGASHVLPISV